MKINVTVEIQPVGPGSKYCETGSYDEPGCLFREDPKVGYEDYCQLFHQDLWTGRENDLYHVRRCNKCLQAEREAQSTRKV